MKDFDSITWQASGLAQAVESLARASGLSPHPAEPPPYPEGVGRGERVTIDRWVEAASRLLGLTAEPVSILGREVEPFLREASPAILRLPGSGPPRYLALLRARHEQLCLLAPDGSRQWIPLGPARSALCREVEAPLSRDAERVVSGAGIKGDRIARAQSALLAERLAETDVSNGWLVRMYPGAPLMSQLHAAGLTRSAGILLATHAAQYLLWILSWWMVGRGALEGRLDPGWLWAWGLLLITLIPLRLHALGLQGKFAIRAGAVLKQRLLHGAMRLAPEEIRRQGAGQLLGRVLESEAVESLALSGGILGALSVLELILAGGVLLMGAAGVLHLLLLLSWLGLSLALGGWYFRSRLGWAALRMQLTNDLVERMVGHRTRLAQQIPERWHDGEDHSVERYVGEASTMDRISACLLAVVPRGWLLLGLLALVPAFAFGTPRPALLAISLGGILLALRGFEKLAWGLWHLVDARVAWGQVRLLSEAAGRPEMVGSPAAAVEEDRARAKDHEPVLEASELVFRYRDRGEAVLQGCSLTLRDGDRVLLSGASGGGKSTLASLLVGLRPPDSGLILSRGLDRKTLGSDSWCRRVVSAPQFHENHILNDTLAFNLLMGRSWPPSPGDMREAEDLCRDLGLGPLLERMPAGLLQMVGESGWQLSHGERSRLFMARALLQDSDVIILDESFAALDPDNLEQCLRTVRERARTLLVIAHA